MSFNTADASIDILSAQKLPFALQGGEPSFDLVRIFCSGRLLMFNRMYCKEILSACGINDQTDLAICIISRALSFRDCYWIRAVDSNEHWNQVNLFRNDFSAKIADVAITGNLSYANSGSVIGMDVYTGELSSKGVRAKCFFRQSERVFLAKRESIDEIAFEVVSWYIARCINIPSAHYVHAALRGYDCSVCLIETSEQAELVPCRDVLQHYQCEMSYRTPYYDLFMSTDPEGFLKMQIFDYITLNVDRNRDNFGLLQSNGVFKSIYPIFDHDSCFKGKSTDAVYFPSKLSFCKTLELLKSKPGLFTAV